ncbi:MAG: phosphoribosyltransferase [Burkholderiales bacterium]
MAHKAFHDRKEAGRVLAQKLSAYANRPDVIVLALPRGGVRVAYYVARELNAPLDVFLVRRLEVPDNKEYAMGAIASGGVRVLDDEVIRALGIQKSTINAVAVREQQELKRQELLYRTSHPPHDVRGRTVILIDDGVATTATLRAAIKALRAHHPARIVVAVPASPAETCQALRGVADEVICAVTPESARAVGDWYGELEDITDEDVTDLLAKSKVAYRAPKGAAAPH